MFVKYKELILPYGSLARLGGPTPHHINLSEPSGRTLSIIGVSHTMDPSSTIIGSIQHEFEVFKDVAQPKLAVIEKRVKIVPDTLNDAVRLYGEAGAAAFYATSAGIAIVCPEPKQRDTCAALCNMFDPSDVCFRQIGEAMGWRSKKTPVPSVEENLRRLIKDRVKNSDIFGFEPTVAWFTSKHQTLFGSQDIGDDAFWRHGDSAFGQHPTMKAILFATGDFRNRFIFQQMSELWNQGNNILLVYGDAHILALEPALRALVLNV